MIVDIVLSHSTVVRKCSKSSVLFIQNLYRSLEWVIHSCYRDGTQSLIHDHPHPMLSLVFHIAHRFLLDHSCPVYKSVSCLPVEKEYPPHSNHSYPNLRARDWQPRADQETILGECCLCTQNLATPEHWPCSSP